MGDIDKKPSALILLAASLPLPAIREKMDLPEDVVILVAGEEIDPFSSSLSILEIGDSEQLARVRNELCVAPIDPKILLKTGVRDEPMFFPRRRKAKAWHSIYDPRNK